MDWVKEFKTNKKKTLQQKLSDWLKMWSIVFVIIVDIHWEYPGAVEYGATVDSKQKFTSLLRVNKMKHKMRFIFNISFLAFFS